MMEETLNEDREDGSPFRVNTMLEVLVTVCTDIGPGDVLQLRRTRRNQRAHFTGDESKVVKRKKGKLFKPKEDGESNQYLCTTLKW